MMTSSATLSSGDQGDGGGGVGASNAVNMNSTATTNTRSALVDFSVGSMPANYGYDESFSKEEDEDESNEESSLTKPRILIMGLRK